MKKDGSPLYPHPAHRKTGCPIVEFKSMGIAEYFRPHAKKINYILLFLLGFYTVLCVCDLIKHILRWGLVFDSFMITVAAFGTFLVIVSVFIYKQRRTAYWCLICVASLSFCVKLGFSLQIIFSPKGSFGSFLHLLRFLALSALNPFLIGLSVVVLRLGATTSIRVGSEAEKPLAKKKLSYYVKVATLAVTFLVVVLLPEALLEGIGELVEGDWEWAFKMHLSGFLFAWFLGFCSVVPTVIYAYRNYYSKSSPHNLFILIPTPLFLYNSLFALLAWVSGFFKDDMAILGIVIFLSIGNLILVVFSSVLSALLFIRKRQALK